MRSQIHLLWLKAPLLCYSLFPLLAIFLMLKSIWALLFLPLFLLHISLKKALLCLSLFLGTLVLVQHCTYFPPSETEGDFLFHISSVELPKQSFQRGFIYKGTIREALGKRTRLRGTLSTQRHLNAAYLYKIHGRVHTKEGLFYSIKAETIEERPQRILSFLEKRSQGKRWLKEKIYRAYPGRLSAPFIVALTTGDSEDYLLRAHLTLVGCAHLLAISGFHFALVASFFHVLLRPLIPYKIHYSLLLVLLTCYLLFLGKSASIYRAFIFAALFFLGPLIKRRPVALNTLGAALGISLLIDPFMVTEVGFQLSFLATAAILFFYPPLSKFLVRSNDCTLMRFLMKALALNISVHLALTPLSLFYFHSLPIHGILYNLFLPSLTAGCLILFLSGLIIQSLLPPLGSVIHFFNGKMTEYFLICIEKRLLYEKNIYIETVANWAVALSFVLFLILALSFQKQHKIILEAEHIR